MTTRDDSQHLREVEPFLPPPRYVDAELPRASSRLMGLELGSPLGVAACPLTSSAEGIRDLAARGYDVLTHKTVRSCEWPDHPSPNWLYVRDLASPLGLDTDLATVVAHPCRARLPEPESRYATVNSYGVGSPPPSVWQSELALAVEKVGDSQLVIASVQGTPERYRTATELAEDFGRVARMAETAGAAAIELNLSCPNTVDFQEGSVQPPICHSPARTRSIVESVRARLHADTLLVAKLSYLPHGRLAEVAGSLAGAVEGVSGINTLQVRVLTDDGEPVFGPVSPAARSRGLAGLSGAPLQSFSLDFVRSLAALRAQHDWGFDIIGMGGVGNPEDVMGLLAAGAASVQVVTAVRNPDLPPQVAAALSASPEGGGKEVPVG